MFTNPVCTYVKNDILFSKCYFRIIMFIQESIFVKWLIFSPWHQSYFFKLTLKHLQLAQPLGLVVNGMSTLLPHEQFKYARQKDEYLVERLLM